MSVDCPKISASGEYQYSVSYSGAVESGTERVRLLLDYRNASKYDCLERKTGLYVESDGSILDVEYIGWDNSFRPPMAEPSSEYTNWTDESFNLELVVYVGDLPSDNVATISLKSYVSDTEIPITVPSSTLTNDCLLSGESFVPVTSGSHNRLNVITESLSSSAKIKSLTYSAGVVTVETFSTHGFSDGDAITISGVERCAHAQGVNGERYNGIYYIYGVTSTTFKYDTMFDGTDYASYRVYAADACPTASLWIAHCWEDNVNVESADIGMATVQWNYDSANNRMVLGDHYLIGNRDGSAKYDAEVYLVSGSSATLTYDGPKIDTDTADMVLAPRVPSSDVPINYPDGAARNVPAYSHSSSTAFISVYDDTTVSTEYSGVKNIASTTLEVDENEIAIFKFNPGYSITGANTVEITCHIDSNSYPSCTLALYEMSSADWTPSITMAEVDDLIIYDILDSAIVDNPGLTGGTAARFIVSGDTVTRWYAAGSPVALAICVLNGNSVDAIRLCSTESDYPITVVGGSGKQAMLNPEVFNVAIKPSVPSIGGELSIYSRGSYQFTGIPGGERVFLGSTECTVVSNTSSVIIVDVPETVSKTSNLIVYRVSGTGIVQETVPLSVTVNMDVSRDVILGAKMKTGPISGAVSYNASYSKDLSMSGFTVVTDANNLIQNIFNCLMTNKGERLFNMQFGSDIESKVFSLYGELDSKGILNECIASITNYEPRVSVNTDKCSVTTSDGGNTLLVELVVSVPGLGEQQVKLPFKLRGRVVS